MPRAPGCVGTPGSGGMRHDSASSALTRLTWTPASVRSGSAATISASCLPMPFCMARKRCKGAACAARTFEKTVSVCRTRAARRQAGRSSHYMRRTHVARVRREAGSAVCTHEASWEPPSLIAALRASVHVVSADTLAATQLPQCFTVADGVRKDAWATVAAAPMTRRRSGSRCGSRTAR